ncbi:MAG: glycosyltransferase [Chlorobiales bacterium]|nr:glycosyltransferase [Chlorobiales bacterium]
MRKNVCHFIRKSTHVRSSFIQNQINNHLRYKPFIVSKAASDKEDGGFALFDDSGIEWLDLSENEDFTSRVLYKSLKLISKNDRSLLTDFLEKNQIQLMHFHFGTDAGIYSPLLAHVKIPSVVSFYGYDCSGFPKKMMGYGATYLKTRVFPYVTKVLAMSPDMKNDLIKAGCPEEKITVHYYGTDVESFYMNRAYVQKDESRFLIISGLFEQKGHLFLLEAFKEAYAQNQKIRLAIVGDGPMRDPITDYIKKYDMHYVSYEGKVVYGSEAHMDYLRNADVFIHPSITETTGDKEGIPGSIVEAMAAGLPVISTYHAGIPYIIEHDKSGLLVKEWDIRALKDQIVRLAANHEDRKRMGVQGQDYAMRYLDLKKKEKELENIYDQLLT